MSLTLFMLDLNTAATWRQGTEIWLSEAKYYACHPPRWKTHLVKVRGLIHQEVSTECVNEESSTKRRSYIRQVAANPNIKPIHPWMDWWPVCNFKLLWQILQISIKINFKHIHDLVIETIAEEVDTENTAG